MTASMSICFGNIAADENEGEKNKRGQRKKFKAANCKT
jgi:hypothetical protein